MVKNNEVRSYHLPTYLGKHGLLTEGSVQCSTPETPLPVHILPLALCELETAISFIQQNEPFILYTDCALCKCEWAQEKPCKTEVTFSSQGNQVPSSMSVSGQGTNRLFIMLDLRFSQQWLRRVSFSGISTMQPGSPLTGISEGYTASIFSVKE
jgi:hypothetical protein